MLGRGGANLLVFLFAGKNAAGSSVAQRQHLRPLTAHCRSIMKVIAVLPAYNAEKTLEKTV